MCQKSCTLDESRISLHNVIFFNIILLMSCNVMGRESDDEVKQVKIGNFAVSGTTQPGTASGFGQNIIDKYSSLGVFYPLITLGKNQSFTQIIPEIIYGIRDDLSILLAFPTAINFKYGGYHSSGSLDLTVQMEYVPWAHHKPTYTNQISLVGWITLPTGNEYKIPATGFGSPSFFLGFTAVHLATEWYAYTSNGGLITTKNDMGIKPGNQFVYQAGFGKNITYASDKWTFMWMVEMSGTYIKKTKIDGIIVNDSQVHSVTIGPALWFSTNNLIVEFGVAPVAYQNLLANQLKSSCVISIYTACRFN